MEIRPDISFSDDSSGRPDIPVSAMVESIVGCKWSIRILELITAGNRQPSQLLRACPGLSTKVMNERLRKMTRFAIISRTVYGEKPPIRVEYEITRFGIRFARIIDQVRELQEEIRGGRFTDLG